MTSNGCIYSDSISSDVDLPSVNSHSCAQISKAIRQTHKQEEKHSHRPINVDGRTERINCVYFS